MKLENVLVKRCFGDKVMACLFVDVDKFPNQLMTPMDTALVMAYCSLLQSCSMEPPRHVPKIGRHGALN
ncbi:hypothetical protein O9993_07185 [Vibrio lentus]|nr:hypothetical protein [Vibrio lentus]